jgi:hypothetical protein
MDNTNNLSGILTESLEKKRVEVITARGAVDAARELQRLQANFVEKAKGELKALVTEGKVSQDIATFVISWLGKSSKVVEEYSFAAKTSLDTKSGEVISLGNVLQLLKQNQAQPTPAPLSPPPLSVPATNKAPEPVKEEKRTYKSRLKKNDVMAKTVERLKKSRKKSDASLEDQ